MTQSASDSDAAPAASRPTLDDPLVPAGRIEARRVHASLQERMFGVQEPTTVDRFEVVEKLGAGAMGIVYKARDPRLDRSVALKVLQPRDDTAESVDRMEREAKALARLRHANVVAVYETGTHDGQRFIAMDLVEGRTLTRWLEEERPSWREILEVFVQAGRGLAAAHAAGLVHRDFKPDNVLVEPSGQAKVVDFGLARPIDLTPSTDPVLATGRHSEAAATTRTGAVVGTPAYMAPEAFEGHTDERSDQFSYCVSLYEALCGRRPFSGKTIGELLGAITQGRVDPPTGSTSGPAWLRRIALRGLAADPGQRFASMDELLHAIERHRRRPYRTAVLAAGGGGLVLGAMAMMLSPEPSRCLRAADKLDAVWNADRRQQIEVAFERTGRPHAPEVWTRASDALDEWAMQWAQTRREACEATYERAEQSEALFDARMRCLDHRLSELDALASLFEQADDQVLDRAVQASRGLDPLEACADFEALQRGIDRGDAEDEAVLGPLHARLARASALEAAGKYEEALLKVTEVAGQADAGGHLALAAAAHLAVARVQDRLEDLDSAERSALTALYRAEEANDERVRAAVTVLLVSVMGRQNDIEAGEHWARLSRAMLARLQHTQRLQAALAANEGNLLMKAGRYEDALARRRQALEIRAATLDPDDPLLADTHYNIGHALLNLGRVSEAFESFEQVIEIRQRTLGPRHPQVARAHAALGLALFDAGEIDKAIERFELAIDLGEETLGKTHPALARFHANLGNAVASGKSAKDSVVHYERAIEIIEANQGPDALGVGQALNNTARVLNALERHTEALEYLQRSLAIHQAILEPNHPDFVYVYNNLAEAYRGLDRHGEALEVSKKGLAVASEALGEHHPMLAHILLNLGETERELGDAAGAVKTLERALSIHDEAETRPGERALVEFALAQARWDAGLHTRAHRTAQLAREHFEADPAGPHPAWLKEIDEWIAQHPLPSH